MIKKFILLGGKSIENKATTIATAAEEEEKEQIKKHIINEVEEKNEDVICGCCCSDEDDDLSSNSLLLSISKKPLLEKSNIIVDGQEKEVGKSQNKRKKRKLEINNAKILIMVGVVLTAPLVLVELMQYYNFLIKTPMIDYFLLTLATVVQILLGGPFYKRFYKSIRRKRKGFNVDTLVVLSTSVAYAYSIISIFTTFQNTSFFEASTSVLTIFTIGEYVESKVLRTTSESIKRLVSLKPKTVTIIIGNEKQQQQQQQKIIDIDELKVGNIFIVKPGDNIATDGVVEYGASTIDESMITGESIPVYKKIGDKVIGGTGNKNGYLHIKATRIGSQTVLANIVEMMRKARENKSSIQRIADKCARYFIPIVLSIACLSSLYWLVVTQYQIQFAITVFATVLVVSCPCALGIATPMVVSLGIGNAAKQGILIKGGKYLEKLSSVETIVFDKTGTLTTGKFEVIEIISENGYSEYDVLQLASSLESKSEHPIAQAIVSKATEKNIFPVQISEFNSIAGKGVVGKYRQKTLFVGNPRAKENISINNNHFNNLKNSTISEKLNLKISELESEGKTVVAVFVDDKIIGIIAIADVLRENAQTMIKQLHQMGKHTILLTGDNERTANAIANKIGIKKVFSQVLPREKADIIKDLQNEKKVVAMVGDGINDAPALTQADIGIAMSSGSDIAMDAGHVILMKNNLSDILFAFKLAKYSMKKIKQNLTISFAYNSISISIAAGLFYGLTNSLVMTPALAAVGWIISDSLVFGNSLFINKFNAR